MPITATQTGHRGLMLEAGMMPQSDVTMTPALLPAEFRELTGALSSQRPSHGLPRHLLFLQSGSAWILRTNSPCL